MIDDNWWKKEEKSGGPGLCGVPRHRLIKILREIYEEYKRLKIEVERIKMGTELSKERLELINEFQNVVLERGKVHVLYQIALARLHCETDGSKIIELEISLISDGKQLDDLDRQKDIINHQVSNLTSFEHWKAVDDYASEKVQLRSNTYPPTRDREKVVISDEDKVRELKSEISSAGEFIKSRKLHIEMIEKYGKGIDTESEENKEEE